MGEFEDILDRDISWQSAALERREVSALELTRAYLRRIERIDRRLNAYVAVCTDSAAEAASAADARARGGKRRGPLDGIPIAVKDNIDVIDMATTAGMNARRAEVARSDAATVERLRKGGAVILGKTNMDEGAMGGTTDNPFFGRTHHPLRRGHTPGGSSGGSAAAVAAGLCSGALGSDTLGSIRIPASYCGIVGLKPTFGLVSMRGIVPLAFRLDHIGLLGRSVEDVALLLDCLKGFDPDNVDSRAAPAAQNPASWRDQPIDGMIVGLLRNFEAIEMDPSVRVAFASAVRRLERLGCRFQPIELCGYQPRETRRAALLCCESDAANTHGAIFTDTPEHLSERVRAMIAYGRNLAAPRLASGQRHLDRISFETRKAFASVEMIISPTTPQHAFPFSRKVPDTQGDMTSLANIAGCPALSVPMGLSPDGLPLGLQMIGRAFDEIRLLALGAAFMAAADAPD